MNLFLIENDTTISVISKSDNFNSNEDIIVCFNYLVYLRCQQDPLIINYHFIEDLFTNDDYEALHSITDTFAMNWYKENGIDFTEYDGISYGEIVEITFSRSYLASILVKYGEAIRKAMEWYPTISVINSDFSKQANYFYFVNGNERFFDKNSLVEKMALHFNKKFNFINPISMIPSANIADLHVDTSKKTLSKIYAVICMFLNILANIINGFNKSKKRIYLTAYFNSNNLLNYKTSNLVIPRIPKSVLKDYKKFFTGIKYVDINHVNQKITTSDMDFINGLIQKVDGIDSNFSYNGIDYNFIYNPIIKNLIRERIPGFILFKKQLKEVIMANNIAKFMVIDTFDEKNHITIQVCKNLNVSTIFVEHGIANYRNAQKIGDKRTPNYYILPGSFNPYPYLGTETRILGTPIMDFYHQVGRRKINKISKVMFLTFQDNFYTRLDRFAYQEKYYKEIFSTFDTLLDNGIDVYYKPHFENKEYHKYLFNFFDVDIEKINYVDKGIFSGYISEIDLLITNVSTCYYESLAAGVPVIFMEPEGSPCDALLPPLNGVNGIDVLRVSTGEELIKVINENMNNPEALNRFVDKFLAEQAPKYMGAMDGQASNRIIDFLNENLDN